MFRPLLWLLLVGLASQSACFGDLPINSIAFSPDGRRVVAANRDQVLMWSVGAPNGVRKFPCSGVMFCLTFGRANNFGGDHIFGVVTERTATKTTQDDDPLPAAFQGRLARLDTQVGSSWRYSQPHADAISSLAIRKNGDVVSFGQGDFTIWNTDFMNLPVEVALKTGFSRALQSVAMANERQSLLCVGYITTNPGPDEVWHVAGSDTKRGFITSFGSQQQADSTRRVNAPVESFAVSPDGMHAWISGNQFHSHKPGDTFIRTWPTTSTGPVAIAGDSSSPLSLVMGDKTVSPLRVNLGGELKVHGSTLDVEGGRCLAMNPQNPESFAVGTSDGKVLLFKSDPKTRAFVATALPVR